MKPIILFNIFVQIIIARTSEMKYGLKIVRQGQIHRCAACMVTCLFVGGTACSNVEAAEMASASASSEAADNRMLDADVVLKGDIAALEAWAFYELGKLTEAEAIARKVLELNPKNVIALQIVADIAEREEEWREVAALWDRVADASLDVRQQQSAASRASQIRDQHASSLQLKGYYAGNALEDAHTGMLLDARLVRAVGPDIIASLDTRQFTGEKPVPASSPEYATSMIAVASLGLAEMRRQLEWDAKLVVSDSTLGSRLGLYRPLSRGRIGLETHYNVPYLAYREGVDDAAAVDSIKLHLQQGFGSLILDASIGLAAYTIKDRQRIVESRLVSVAISKTLGKRWSSSRLVYILDAENMANEETAALRSERASSSFKPESREVHSLSIHHRVEASRLKLGNTASAFDFGAGYRSDRIGQQGPFVSLSASLPLQRKLDVRLSIDYAASANSSSSEPSDSYLAAYLNFRWKFANGEYRR